MRKNIVNNLLPTIVYYNDTILVRKNNLSPFLDYQNDIPKLKINITNTFSDDLYILLQAANSKISSKQSEFEFIPIKTCLKNLTSNNNNNFIRYIGWIHWQQQTNFCTSCGENLIFGEIGANKFCPNCRKIIFPKFAPAIMVLITKGDKILLARGKHHPPGVYTALAGFVELGESLEDTIYREVKEEVGLEVKNLKYFSSQHWPFPDSFMIAFYAEYKSGNINIDNDEIEDAKWFTKNDLPNLPMSASIAYKLITKYINEL